MGKIGLVDDVLAGKEVDRPPLTLWYHFGLQHGKGIEYASTVLDFFRYYDFDYLKVMNDYFYPMPDGLSSVKSRDDLEKIAPFDLEKSDWMEQLRALEFLGKELKGEAYFIDTVFDPWHTFKRSLAGENALQLMEEEPEGTLKALDIITKGLIAYCRRSIEAGSAGIFLSVVAGRELIGRDHFLKFVKPFATRVLRSVSGAAMMNTVHIHGDDLYFEECLDFPADIFNWWDRGPGGPSLESVKEKIRGCVMGGIDHNIVNRATPEFLKNHVLEGRKLGGYERFFLAGGCSISTSVAPRAIKSIVDGAREKF